MVIAIIIGTLPVVNSCTADITFTVMSFNIRYHNPEDGVHSWENRKQRVARLINYYRPDILGLQEALHDQVLYLDKNLKGYKWVGSGRDDGRQAGEYTAIFYNIMRFTAIKSHNFWLSDTPEIPGSIGWDAACTRMVTCLLLRDTISGENLYVFNTHFDHVGQTARIMSAKLLLQKIEQTDTSGNVVITGDFNSSDSSTVYTILTSVPHKHTISFSDARYVCAGSHKGPDWTYQGFHDTSEKKKLDYIFISDTFQSQFHQYILDPDFGKFVSDHLPVFTKIEYKN